MLSYSAKLQTAGVKQGEPFSPLPYILFLKINDLSKKLGIDTDTGYINRDIIDLFFQKFILPFADDAILISDSPQELQITE